MPLYSEQCGSRSNPTLVFLHGFLGNSSDWKDVIHYLKDDFHCVTIDLPGHGRSVASAAPLTNGFERCHKHIKFTLDELNIQRYSMLGYSLGGRIALDYARSQNDARLVNLILESSHIGLSNEEARTQRYQRDLSWAERFAIQPIDETLYQWYEQTIFDDLDCEQKDLLIDKRNHNYGAYLANMLLSTSLANQQNATDFLSTTELSITYLYGQKDNKFKGVSALMPVRENIKIKCFNGLGHNTHQQDPISYANTIKQIHP